MLDDTKGTYEHCEISLLRKISETKKDLQHARKELEHAEQELREWNQEIVNKREAAIKNISIKTSRNTLELSPEKAQEAEKKRAQSREDARRNRLDLNKSVREKEGLVEQINVELSRLKLKSMPKNQEDKSIDYHINDPLDAVRILDAEIKSLTELLETKPDCLESLYSRGTSCQVLATLVRLEGYSEVHSNSLLLAIKDFTAAITIEPSNLLSRNRRADANFTLGDITAAETDADYVLEIDEFNRDALRTRGDLYYQRNDFPAAKRTYEKLLETDPTKSWIHNRSFIIDRIEVITQQQKVKPAAKEDIFGDELKNFSIALEDLIKMVGSEPEFSSVKKNGSSSEPHSENQDDAIREFFDIEALREFSEFLDKFPSGDNVGAQSEGVKETGQSKATLFSPANPGKPPANIAALKKAEPTPK